MSRHTSLKVGGPADLFAIPADTDDLKSLLRQLARSETRWMAIGRGFNLLVKDGGIRGAVISLERFNRINLVGETLLRVEAGAENLEAVRYAQRLGLGGIGFIAGIPGTLGGAVRMNAGAYGQGILERMKSIKLLRNGEISEFSMDELEFGYRHLALHADDIILEAQLELVKRSPEETEEEIRKDAALRREKHNVGFPSAGSFFRNPPGQSAWRLIDASGMRGAQVGGAQVAELHSNFLVNRGDATAADFLALAEKVKCAVLQNCGTCLEEEVRIVGEEP
jgi:UDP-N-acetylmuramate dehydrogenase